jgi:hypothetical protein
MMSRLVSLASIVSPIDQRAKRFPAGAAEKAGGNAPLTTSQFIAAAPRWKPRRKEMIETSLTELLPCVFNVFSEMRAGRPEGAGRGEGAAYRKSPPQARPLCSMILG